MKSTSPKGDRWMIPNSAMDGNLLLGLVSAWGVTYLIHSTLLLGAVWVLSQTRRLSPGWQDTLWKVALIGGLVTATWQTTVPENTLLGGRINLGIVGAETTTELSPNGFPAQDPLPVFSDNTFQSLPPVNPPSSRGYLGSTGKSRAHGGRPRLAPASVGRMGSGGGPVPRASGYHAGQTGVG